MTGMAETVLIVDDTPHNVALLRDLLVPRGYRTYEAENGLQALELLRAEQPDIILLDVMMPGLDGFETCRRLKANAATRDIPVIFLTARAEETDLLAGFEAGAVDYLTKPFNHPELLKRVETHVQLHKLQQSLERQVEEKTEQLLRAQKLEGMGQLAAGIAHEVSSPVQFISTNAELAGHALATLQGTPGAEAQHCISEIDQSLRAIEEGVSRIVEIVSGMRVLAHPSVGEQEHANLNSIVEGATAVCRHEWKYVAELDLALAEDLPKVLCYPGEISQAVVNLIVNAAHAIADAIEQRGDVGGRIRVATGQDGAWVKLSVGDNGSGIPAHVRERMFDLFFTTKALNRGTGQGLSLVQRVITERHGGQVSCDTEVGKGTTFTISMPIDGMAAASDA